VARQVSGPGAPRNRTRGDHRRSGSTGVSKNPACAAPTTFAVMPGRALSCSACHAPTEHARSAAQ
jgi:hypothetical protein